MVKNIINSGLTNEMLEMTYPDKYYKDVIEPAKLGKGPVPSKMQMMMKSQPFKAVTMPFREMMSPGKFGAFRSSGTPLASKALGLGRTALGGPFGIGSLIGTGIGMGADAIARATNTPQEYEAMKEKARSDYMGTGYFDDIDISQDAPTTAPGSIMNEIEIGTAPGVFDINQVGDPALNPGSVNVFGLDPFGVNEDLIERGAVPEEGAITDRGRSGAFATPGEMGAYEMIGGTPVAVGDVLGMQQALEKADFYEEPSNKKGLASFFNNPLSSLAMRLSPVGFLQDVGKLNSARNAFNSFRSGSLGNAVNTARTGLGSLGSKLAGKMRGINPITGRPNTQREYEANRTSRQQQSRTDAMIDRIANNKTTRSDPRDAGTTDKQKADISAAIQDRARTGQYDNDGGGSGGSSKIVCTMMNERYGFGSFRNKIWMKFHEHHGPEYQKGYHAIFLPLVKIAKGEGKINTAVRKVLEHMGRHVTADMFKIMKGKKRDTLGRIYRAIFEPACHIIGKIKSALGRG